MSDSVLYIAIIMFVDIVTRTAKLELQHEDRLRLAPTELIFIYKSKLFAIICVQGSFAIEPELEEKEI